MNTLVTLSISATFAIEPVKEYIEFWVDQLPFDLKVRLAPYNQVLRELATRPLNDNNDIQFRFIGIRPEDFTRFMPKKDEGWQKDFARNAWRTYVDAIRKSCENSADIFLVAVFPPSAKVLSDALLNYFRESISLFQTSLSDLHNLNFIDLSALPELYDVTDIYDEDSDQMAHIPFTTEYYAALGTTIVRSINGYMTRPHKVIVLDCDNTLWRGVCAEETISVEPMHRALQEFMLNKRSEGFLLALASKNNEPDVAEVFHSSTGMVLMYDHFIVRKIGWGRKSDYIDEIATELGLAKDSFIFVDDNPLECEQMRILNPAVLTIHVDPDADSVKFLRHVWAFDRIKVTEEDLARNASYSTELQRKAVRSQFEDEDDFIRYLGVEVSIVQAQTTGIHRVSQLMNRTNQFNLNGVVLAQSDIRKRILDSRSAVWEIHVKDRYGDYGRSGAVVCSISSESLIVESLLLSCRVLGRNVEGQVIDFIRSYSRDHRLYRVDARYIPTKSNTPVLQFLQKSGFHCADGTWFTTLEAEVAVRDIRV